ncbi:MAG: hypothetical protein ABSD38_37520 [Syntrophorhabdales bacterium]|jgi:hypothetical protein
MTDTPKKNPVSSKPKNSKPEDESQTTTQVLRAELQIPPSVTEACQTDNRKKNRFEWGKIIIQIVTLGVISVYTYIAYHQWDITKQALTANERPWLAVDVDIGGDLKFQKTDGTVVIPLIIKITNLGKQLAQNVSPEFKVIVSDPADVPLEEPKIFAYATEAAKAKPRSVSFVGHALFPDKDTPWIVGESFVISSKDVKSIKGTFTDTEGPRQLMIFGCVAYKYALDESIHRTGFIGEIGMKPISGVLNGDVLNGVTFINAITKNIPSEQLKIARMLEGFFAD